MCAVVLCVVGNEHCMCLDQLEQRLVVGLASGLEAEGVNGM